MNIGVYFCNCGTNVSDKIDADEVRRQLQPSGLSYFQDVPFGCSEDGQAFLERHIKEHRPDRVVIAACSPREHEETFRRVMDRAGLNPYLMQMVNVREHVGWVTTDKAQATRKAVSQLKGALARVRKHEPLEKQFLDVRTEALVIGAGPAGLRAALELAEAGRKVTLVEKMPVLGGMPVLYEEVFPKMECGPCLLEPVLGEVLHGPHASRIEVLLLSEVVRTAGSYGNFIVTIRKAPRYVAPQTCIG
ncbi:MAG: CoB--CoM heterodisulfide reductase iron-sulfur subunit A family protein, partial [Lentisphaerae bacterium]|nr:CoB--CoM heterodisulfide reductase iron-sulfur subunit A family protein [Lentisphaerota bacterium]